jgi:hypothetical protein
MMKHWGHILYGDRSYASLHMCMEYCSQVNNYTCDSNAQLYTCILTNLTQNLYSSNKPMATTMMMMMMMMIYLQKYKFMPQQS